MKHKTIRQNVFETNSSSTHSVTIVNGPHDMVVKAPDSWEDFELNTGHFGWENKTYKSFDSKLKYAFTLTQESENDQYLDMLKKVLRTNILGEYDFKLGYTDGYVDHQSVDGMADEIFESEETLESFLFCKQSYFTTGNDNE